MDKFSLKKILFRSSPDTKMRRISFWKGVKIYRKWGKIQLIKLLWTLKQIFTPKERRFSTLNFLTAV